MKSEQKTASAAQTAAASNGFYATYGMIDSVDLLIHDARNILKKGQLNWINFVIYDPIQNLYNTSTTLKKVAFGY